MVSTHKQLNEFNKVVAQLTNIGANLDDENKVMMVLSSLLATNEHIVTTLLYGKESIGVEVVMVAVLSNEMRKID